MPDPSHVVQSQPSAETMRLIDLVAADAAEILGVSLDDSPQSIVTAVNGCVRDLQQGGGPELDESEDIITLLGSLWGNQIVKAFGWRWTNIDLTDRDPPFAAIGVVSPESDKVIYPFNFVAQCREKDVVVNILLVFNVLSDKPESAVYEPGSCENVMTRIAHIVPPE
ncbi:hypothetical protein C5Y96_07720 [Blastopirellula marina]|uniref:Uncharacterized protein n=1 Tax=Blastopirellula marina TaxID=124 RepID=A0A2S8FXY2_9BACT|nr:MULTISPECIES: hypothetical protein [Pirellulaceae]PQO37037.1 hypothetical protein C5Y96_07720 [Blastopirellula marina]RCS53752.1 hypothetical protein DTL36_07730 [Bremerella cremea]